MSPCDKACDKPKNATFRAAVLTHFGSEFTSLPDKIQYLAYGHETCPSTGKPHLQMWAYASNSMRFSQWKKIFPGDHIEPMNGSFAQNDAYCSKEGKLVEFGIRPFSLHAKPYQYPSRSRPSRQ